MGDDNGEIATTGVVLELLDWTQIASEPVPRIAAKYETGPRARIARFLYDDMPENKQTYLVAEIDIIDDSPALTNHAEVQAAWQNMWSMLGYLVELQEQAKERPRLTSAALALGQKCGVLSACDVWRPVSLMQELYYRQASAVHARYGSEIASADASGAPINELQTAYKAELDILKASLGL